MATATPSAPKILPLEDTAFYILMKAIKGRGLTKQQVALRAGLGLRLVEDVLEHPAENLEALDRLAFVLNLCAKALRDIATDSWQPKATTPLPGFRQFTTPFGSDMTVNAYLCWDAESKQAVSFDTGTRCDEMLTTLEEEGLTLQAAFVTHTHMDHLQDLDRLIEKTGATAYGPAIENPLDMTPVQHADGVVVEGLSIRAIATPGHTPGGTSYYITGLERPVVVTGDALFAGSAGGAPLAWASALEHIENRLLSLPGETIVAPGHGPCSTIAEERRHNPLFPHIS